jgi:hypothetical protein
MTASADRRKAEYGYDSYTPHCANCVGYRKAVVTHDDLGATVVRKPFCTKGRFNIVPGGCCDKWSNRNGERLSG